MFIILWDGGCVFGFFFPRCVWECIAGPDSGNNLTGNWAALSKINCSCHLL